MHTNSYSKAQMENAVRVVNAIERIPADKQSLFLLRRTQHACKELRTGLIFSESKPAQGRAPKIFDDLLMMCQTEKLETDGARCEKSTKYTP